MDRKTRFLRRTCRQAAALLIAREDQPLAIADRIALKLHLLACQACPNFENQVRTLRRAMGAWRNYAGDAGSESSKTSTDK